MDSKQAKRPPRPIVGLVGVRQQPVPQIVGAAYAGPPASGASTTAECRQWIPLGIRTYRATVRTFQPHPPSQMGVVHVWKERRTSSRGRFMSRVQISMASTAAIAATLVFAAPQAGANATLVNPPVQGLSFGTSSNFGTNCEYEVSAAVDDPATKVVFTDSLAANFTPPDPMPMGNVVTTRWRPTATGSHVITATQGGAAISAPITVGSGLSIFGIACVVY